MQTPEALYPLELVTPEKVFFKGEVAMAILPAEMGDMGVMLGHSPCLVQLRPGVLYIYEGNKVSRRFFLRAGVADVKSDKVVVLSEEAIEVEQLQPQVLEQSRRDLTEDLQDAKTDDEKDSIFQQINWVESKMDAIKASHYK